MPHADISIEHAKDERRKDLENAFEDALQALHAQGLEPSDFAKGVVERVLAGEITIKDAIKSIEDRYKEKYHVK